MVNRIPGSGAQVASSPGGGPAGGSQRRGLRSKVDQILINGKRITGKSNEADQFLERLSANKVIRIEVYDGIVVENESSAGARTLNIITAGDGLGSGTWKVGVRHTPDLRTTGLANLTYSGTLRNARYNLGIETMPNGSLTRRTDSTSIGNVPAEEVVAIRERFAHKNRVTGSASIPLRDNNSLQLNALYAEQSRRGTNFIEVSDVALDGSSIPASVSSEPLERKVTTVEFGGTYDSHFKSGSRLQVLFLRSTNEDDRTSSKTETLTNGGRELNHEVRDQSSDETVLRGTWFRSASRGSDLDVGLELAINTLDKRVGLFEGDTEPLQPVFIPNADQVIQENRAEAFLNYSRTRARLHYRLGLAAEYSEFDQQGTDVSLSRTLSYIKPSLDVSFSQTKTRSWFLTIVRDVSQLNFDDFVASIDPVDREIRAGNLDLLPETSWNLEIGVENHLPNDAGLVKVKLFHNWVSDVDDLVPLGLDDYQPGNLPDGRRWGMTLNLGIRFDAVGLDGAVLNAFYNWRDSETIDPFTGQRRRIFGQKSYEAGLDFRQDLKRIRGAYGLKWSFEGDRIRYEHDRIDVNNGDDNIELFFQKRLGKNLIMTLALNQLTEPESTRLRKSFDPDRVTGTQDETSRRGQVLRRFATLSVRGSF